MFDSKNLEIISFATRDCSLIESSGFRNEPSDNTTIIRELYSRIEVPYLYVNAWLEAAGHEFDLRGDKSLFFP